MSRSGKKNSRDPQVWVTRDGRSVRVDAMDDAHLLNTIVYLNRRASRYIAERALKVGIDDILARGVPQYANMLAETVRRGLMDITAASGARRPAAPPRSTIIPRSTRARPSIYSRFAELIFED